jgi:alpha-beta hydrolase superfamily lysophospholipase
MVHAHPFRFTSADGLSIFCTRWDGDRAPRGVVQIAHGLGEHMGRYAGVIECLVDAGLVVYGNDHRGHGRTAPSPEFFGDFGPGGFDLLVEDMRRLSCIAIGEQPGRPLILLGHSMGSFAAQKYALDYSGCIFGLVLSGSGALDGLVKVVRCSRRDPGDLLNARFQPARTPCDWLSRDPATVDAFLNDPLCFGWLQPAAAESFFAAAAELADPARLTNIRRDLPIYLFSGVEDPVGQRLRGFARLIGRYRQAGVYGVSYDFYPGGRHEMLNETNREQVRRNLLRWIAKVID